MRIAALIADWGWLREFRETGDEGGGPAPCRSDSFTRWDDSYRGNSAVGDLFVALRPGLPAEVAAPIEEYLVAFCPALADGSRFRTPRDPELADAECDHASLTPEAVRRHLLLLDGVDLPAFFARVHAHHEAHGADAFAEQAEVVRFVFMWSAALGEAAARGWGLVVTVG